MDWAICECVGWDLQHDRRPCESNKEGDTHAAGVLYYDYEPYVVKEDYQTTETYQVDVDKTRQVAVYKRNEVIGKEEYTATKNVPYYRNGRFRPYRDSDRNTPSIKYKRYEDSGKTKQEERTRSVDLYKREEDSARQKRSRKPDRFRCTKGLKIPEKPKSSERTLCTVLEAGRGGPVREGQAHGRILGSSRPRVPLRTTCKDR